MCERFTAWVEQEVIKAPLVEGVEDFLKAWQGKAKIRNSCRAVSYTGMR